MFFPKVTINIQHTDTVAPAGLSVSERPLPAWATTVTLVQPLYRWGSLQQGLEAAKELLERHERDFLPDPGSGSLRRARGLLPSVDGAGIGAGAAGFARGGAGASPDRRTASGGRRRAAIRRARGRRRVANVQQALAQSQGDLCNAWATLSQVHRVRPSSRRDLGAGPAAWPSRTFPSIPSSGRPLAAAPMSARPKRRLADGPPKSPLPRPATCRTLTSPSAARSFPIPALSLETFPDCSAKTACTSVSAPRGRPFDADQTHGKVVTATAQFEQAAENVRLVKLQAEQDVKTSFN